MNWIGGFSAAGTGDWVTGKSPFRFMGRTVAV
jgi:hypothetical protein